MARLSLISSALILTTLTGCAGIPSPVLIPRDPLPQYVSPLEYEGQSCESLQYAHSTFEGVLRFLKPVMDSSSMEWDVKVGNGKVRRSLKKRGFDVPPDTLLFDLYTESWGRYIAVQKISDDQQCGIPDTDGYTPWQSVYQ